jgi:carboxyl-terminal processing protease
MSYVAHRFSWPLLVLLLIACSGSNSPSAQQAHDEATAPQPSATASTTALDTPTATATATVTATATPNPQPRATAVVREGVQALAARFYTALDPDVLFIEAWQGATAALAHAGVTAPPPPEYPPDEAAAALLHDERFPELERLAAGVLTTQELITAALTEVTRRRADCHTSYIAADRARPLSAGLPVDGGVRVGIQLNESPLRITNVVPGSPASTAGLRRGQIVEAIDGRLATDLPAAEAVALISKQEGVPTRFAVRDTEGNRQEVAVAPARLPLVGFELLPGGAGIVRFDVFPEGTVLPTQLRAAFETLEQQGARAWILDLRYNAGGLIQTMVAATSLFTDGIPLFGERKRSGDSFTGPRGRPLETQRPMVVLVGPRSTSGAEFLAGALQVHGRATLVGEQTRGCIGMSTPVPLADGSRLTITVATGLLGPERRLLNGIGITPDIVVGRDEGGISGGPDLQLEAALRVLSIHLNGP